MAHAEGPFSRQPFDHRQHVKFAWTVLKEVSLTDAVEVVSSEIREFAALHAPGKYHQTLTEFWVRLVAHTCALGEVGADFDEHLARFPILMNSSAQKHHYSETVLASELARQQCVEPDLVPIP
jgi:hypothetical protein